MRNPLIADVCFKGGYIDAQGRGTIRIIEICEEVGSQWAHSWFKCTESQFDLHIAVLVSAGGKEQKPTHKPRAKKK